jgi:uncharacterized protein
MTAHKASAAAETGEEVLLRVRVQPRASKASIRLEEDGTYRLAVTAPPVDDAANVAVCAYLAKLVGVSKRDISIANGEHSRLKTIRIAHVDKNETLQKLRSHINS